MHAEGLADIVNGVSDYKTQFILAKDFQQKGMNDLAASTFNIALAAADEAISESTDPYSQIEARFLIERYGCAMERFDLVKKHGLQVLQSIKNMDFEKTSAARTERVSYIKSQSYLWLAESSSRQKKYANEIDYLNRFLNCCPDSADVDYARYRLGRAYERMGRRTDAVKTLQKIDDRNMWKTQARRIMKEVDIEKK
jgi:tetratricopeptide (TPR) repeat protein